MAIGQWAPPAADENTIPWLLATPSPPLFCRNGKSEGGPRTPRACHPLPRACHPRAQAYATQLEKEMDPAVWNGLRVRIGMHYGYGDIKLDPTTKGYDYYGTVVNTAARIESVCHGGQIGISQV